MTNLSFYCKGETDSQEYEIASLNFDTTASRTEMIAFLTNIKSAKVTSIKKFHEYYLEDTEGPTYKLILIDKFQNSMNVSTLINSASSLHQIEIIMKKNFFRYSLIVSVWEAVRELRSLGLKNMGINSSLVYLAERLTPLSLNDRFLRYKNFFESPEIQIEYKINQFRNLLLADARNELTMKELVGLNFFSEKLSQKFSNKMDAIKDHNSFIVYMLEVVLCQHHSEFLDGVDFDNRRLSERLKNLIEDKLILEMIDYCFHDREQEEERQTFFTGFNAKMSSLNMFQTVEVSELRFNSINWEVFNKGIKLVPKGLRLKFLLSLDIREMSREHLRLIANEHMNSFIVKETLGILSEYETDFESQLIVVRCINFFLGEILENNRKNVLYMDTRELRQYVLYVMNLYQTYSDVVP
jgi:hypothetical protein